MTEASLDERLVGMERIRAFRPELADDQVDAVDALIGGTDQLAFLGDGTKAVAAARRQPALLAQLAALAQRAP